MKKSNDIDKIQINEWLKKDSPVPVKDIEAAEDDLIRFVSTYAVEPDPMLRGKILNKLNTLISDSKDMNTLDLDNLPVLNESSNWSEWQEAVKHIEPPTDYEGIYLHNLESTDQRELFVAWVKEYIEEEVHSDLIESFILLEGTCECHITDQDGHARIVRMGVGDFITMNVGETHDVIITSLQPAKAILQWMKLRA